MDQWQNMRSTNETGLMSYVHIKSYRYILGPDDVPKCTENVAVLPDTVAEWWVDLGKNFVLSLYVSNIKG